MTATSAAQTPLDDLLRDIVLRYRSDNSGEVATYIPELGRANPDWFGVCIVTIDGATYEAGDSRQEFTIQSISKPFAYGMALERLGRDEVRKHVGVEPSGDAFNSISLQPQSGRPLNPMINAGAIAISHMLYRACKPDAMGRMLEWFSSFAGRQLGLDTAVYESESSTGHRNRAIAHLLRNFDVVSDPVEDGLDLYFKQCSILTTCHDLAVMAATLANHGINPITQQAAMPGRYVEDVLSVMTTCGMYNYAGQWLYDVGLPAKSGVAGGIMAVLPGRMGIGVFSPRLDAQGNSVRGIRACQELSEQFGLHLFRSHRISRAVVRNEMSLEHRTSSRVRSTNDTRKLLTLGGSAYMLELQGDLHFSSVEIVQRQIWKQISKIRVLLIDLARVDSVDDPALEAIERMLGRLREVGIEVAFSGVARDGEMRRQLLTRDDRKLMFGDLESAMEAAEESLLRGTALAQVNGSPPPQTIPFNDLEISNFIDPPERGYLETIMIRRSYDAGACICRKGDPAGEIFFLTQGTVSVRLYSDEQTFQRLAVFTPGSVFGEVAAIDRGPRSADVWTESAVDCMVLRLESFDRLEVDRPALKIKLLKYLLRIVTARLRRANDLIGHLAG